MATVLDEVAGVGPFFSVDTAPDTAGHPLWRPLTDLYGRALADQIATVRHRLGTREPRVAASILFQGIAGRLWSPVLAASVAHGVVPDLDPRRTYWRAASPGPILLAVPSSGGLEAGPDVVHRVIVERHLRPLALATREKVSVAEGLLWGNAASALAGALQAFVSVRPDLIRESEALVERLFAVPPLRGTGTLFPGGGFLRGSCCLYYRVPGGGKCGDCALA